MAISEAYTGTEAVTTTEWSMVNDSSTIATVATDGIYQAFIDVNALAAGDQYQIRVYEKARGADTQRVVYQAILTGAQAEPIWVSPALVLVNAWDFTLKKLSGTDRTITWSIRSVA